MKIKTHVPNSMGQNKRRSKRDVYSDKGLSQETNKQKSQTT